MPDFSFITLRESFTVFHLLGVALGLGGALFSDLLFFRAARNGVLSRGELTPLLLGSHAVTAGLALLIVSGAGLFALDTERYLASTKFLSKMTVVGVLTLNGIILHVVHIPRLRHMAGRRLFEHASGARYAFVVSGTVSLVSWVTALTLGSFSGVPLAYGQIIGAYAIVLLTSVVCAVLLSPHLFSTRS